jgi:predicted dehydrogenase
MQPVRLGVIGAGLIWIRVHQPILRTLADAFAPIAFCDVSEQRRAAVARDFPGALVSADYHDVLEHPEVETVLVLTPIALNAPTARAALLAGKDVIMEKPIARSVAEARELVATARRLGRRLFVAEQLAYRAVEDQLAELLGAGEIGELVLWERVQHLEPDTAAPELRYSSTPWRKQADFPLGTMFDGGIHLIASLTRVFGTPATVAASGRQLRPEYGEYDHVAALFQYASGVAGMISHSSCLAQAHNHYFVHGTAGMLSVEHNQIVLEKPSQPARVVELAAENAYASMWNAFVGAVRDQSEPRYTPERALHDVAILEAIDHAIKSGTRVPVLGMDD